jgi:hypothetical protein
VYDANIPTLARSKRQVFGAVASSIAFVLYNFGFELAKKDSKTLTDKTNGIRSFVQSAMQDDVGLVKGTIACNGDCRTRPAVKELDQTCDEGRQTGSC